MQVSLNLPSSSIPNGSVQIANNGTNSQTVTLGPSNVFQFPDVSVVPPINYYFQITTLTGGAILEGTHGPLVMPPNSTATFVPTAL
jgi:hypothetical protein